MTRARPVASVLVARSWASDPLAIRGSCPLIEVFRRGERMRFLPDGSGLVFMRGQLRRYGIEESVELPDHLTHVLPLLDRLEQNEPDKAREFVKAAVLPAMEKMLEAFQKKDSPYENVLLAIAGLLRQHQEQQMAEVTHG